MRHQYDSIQPSEIIGINISLAHIAFSSLVAITSPFLISLLALNIVIPYLHDTSNNWLKKLSASMP